MKETGMRKLAAVLAVALAAGACETDATGPMADDMATSLQELASLAYGVTQVGDDATGPGIMERLAQLPPEIALSGAQFARISGIIDELVAATAADRAALAAIRAEAVAAREAGATPAEIRAILEPGRAIRQRLHELERTAFRAIMAELTPAQRRWLMNQPPPPPRPCALTDAQRTEISGLRAAFEQDNAADIALLRSVHERAVAAREAGAPRAEIAAILAEGREAAERLRAARQALHEAVRAVLTPEQLAAGCFR
jgi:Spy/CpxP family protein refolding chaperone